MTVCSHHVTSIDVSAKINGSRVYGELIFQPNDGKATYIGDIEQCDDCGHDSYEVIKREQPMGLAWYTGHALLCQHCGAAYQLKSEEG